MLKLLAPFLLVVLVFSWVSPGRGQALQAQAQLPLGSSAKERSIRRLRVAVAVDFVRNRNNTVGDEVAAFAVAAPAHEDEVATKEQALPRVLQQSFSFSPAVNSTKSLGKRSFFFVRVSARDSTPHPFTLRQWIRVHFRTHYRRRRPRPRQRGSQIPGTMLVPATSFKTVVEGCSFGKLKVVSNGGMDVTLDRPLLTYNDKYEFVAEAQAKVEAALGYPMDRLADHIVYCQPRDFLPNWIAVGIQNGNRINIHGTRCLSLSLLMHEWGHNLNLLHSGTANGDEYGDMTGTMGGSAVDKDGPKRCFNGYKHYQLRWFEDRHLVVRDFALPRRVLLAAFCDYNKTGPEHAVIVNVADLFYLQYNRAKGINAGTMAEMRDRVTVTHNDLTRSVLDRGLTVGESFVCVHGDCRSLFVSVCRRADATEPGQPDIVEIAIGYDKNWC